MTDQEKIEAFDNLSVALTNRWHDGKWSWWCCDPPGSYDTRRPTRDEAVSDLVEWAKATAKRKVKCGS